MQTSPSVPSAAGLVFEKCQISREIDLVHSRARLLSWAVFSVVCLSLVVLRDTKKHQKIVYFLLKKRPKSDERAKVTYFAHCLLIFTCLQLLSISMHSETPPWIGCDHLSLVLPRFSGIHPNLFFQFILRCLMLTFRCCCSVEEYVNCGSFDKVN